MALMIPEQQSLRRAHKSDEDGKLATEIYDDIEKLSARKDASEPNFTKQNSDGQTGPKSSEVMRNDGAQAFLPALEIFSANRASERFIADSSLLSNLKTTGHQKMPTVERDASGQLTTFVDLYGNQFSRQGDGFINRRDVVSARGVTVESDDKSVKVSDKATGITRSTTITGIETTDYSAVGGGRTTRRIVDGVEHISIESKNRATRTLELERNENGARVRSYTDSSGNTFTLAGRQDDKDRPVYVGVDRDGKSLGANFRVTADRSGNVVVRNEDAPDSPQYARRELNNGTIVTSDRSNEHRVVTNADGKQLDPQSAEAEVAQRSLMIQETPPNVDIAANERLAERHQLMPSTLFTFATNAVNMEWFASQVRTGAAWDFKGAGAGNNVMNSQYEDFGNWNFGRMGTLMGFDAGTLQARGGAYQREEGTSKAEWGSPGYLNGWLAGLGHSGTYGDDPRDNAMIRRGMAVA